MKFIVVLMIAGTLLVVAPVAHHAYYLHQFVQFASIELVRQEKMSFPHVPISWYIVSAVMGGILLVTSLVIGSILQFSQRASSELKAKSASQERSASNF